MQFGTNKIDRYLVDIPTQQKVELEKIRKIVRQTVPEAEETISYGLPAFKYKGQPVIYFGAFKSHLSIFPTSKPVEALKDKLKDYKITKGTIQFTLDKPLPESLIKDLIAYRIKQISP